MSIKLHEVQVYVPAGHNNTINYVQKVWGMEHIYPTGLNYTTKIMKVLPGSRCSLHYHRDKEENFVLVAGKLQATFFDQDGTKNEIVLVNPGDALILPKCTPHTFSVPADQESPTIFIESSTHDTPEDSYRLDKSQGPGE